MASAYRRLRVHFRVLYIPPGQWMAFDWLCRVECPVMYIQSLGDNFLFVNIRISFLFGHWYQARSSCFNSIPWIHTPMGMDCITFHNVRFTIKHGLNHIDGQEWRWLFDCDTLFKSKQQRDEWSQGFNSSTVNICTYLIISSILINYRHYRHDSMLLSLAINLNTSHCTTNTTDLGNLPSFGSFPHCDEVNLYKSSNHESTQNFLCSNQPF